mgnify:CR=1 FL=1
MSDTKLRNSVCIDVFDYAEKCNLKVLDITCAPIKERKNMEYLILLEKNGVNGITKQDFINKIENYS